MFNRNLLGYIVTKFLQHSTMSTYGKQLS